MKKSILFVLSLLIFGLFSMNACSTAVYRKKHVDLYSVAIHSILGVWSSSHDEVVVIDEDKYGRKLFFANIGAKALGRISGVFILQKTDDQYAYYYEDKNYIIKDTANKLTKENVYHYIPLEKIESLKERNDWGKEERAGECFKVPIRGDKYYLSEKISDKTIENVGKDFFYKVYYDIPMCEDPFGHIIWFMKGLVNEEDSQQRYYVFFFNADGTLNGDDAVMEIDDIWDYSEQMIAFKEANHWNKEA